MWGGVVCPPRPAVLIVLLLQSPAGCPGPGEGGGAQGKAGEGMLVSTGSPTGLHRPPNPSPLHRKFKTQILGQPNPETKGNKIVFRAHFESYSKSHFVDS